MTCSTVGALCLSAACGGALIGLGVGSLLTWCAWCADVRRLTGGRRD